MTNRQLFSPVILAAALWSTAASVMAQTPEPAPQAASVSISAATDIASNATALRSRGLWNLPAVPDHVLANRSGGTDIGAQLSDMKLRGVVSDNRAVNVATGANFISEGALANSSGVPMVIQNSGNNVLIQNATIVNVHLQ